MTKQRQLIRDVIMSSDEHLNAAQIYQAAKSVMPSIAFGTVYRNLGLMSDDGEIRRVPIPGAPDIYDKNPVPHGHIICLRCGKVCDECCPDISEMIMKSTEKGALLVSYNLNIQVICKDCSSKIYE